MMSIRFGFYFVLLVGFIAPLFVSAHATPEVYTPDSGSTVLQTPASISVRFTERIEVGASSLRVFAPNGEEVNEGLGVLSDEDPRMFIVPIRDQGEGVYAVSWQVISVDDGHFTKGAFSFLVDSTGKTYEGEEAETTVLYSTNLVDVTLGFLVLVGESLLLTSAVWFLLIKTPPPITVRLLSHATVIGGGVFILSSSCAYIVKALELAELRGVSLFSGIAMYGSVTVGTAILLKVFLVTFFVSLFLYVLQRTSLRYRVVPLGLLGISLSLLLCVQGQVSHAMASHFEPVLSVLITVIHLASKELIIGSSVLLFLLYMYTARRGEYEVFFSHVPKIRIASSSVLPFAITSGTYVTWLHLKHFENLFLTEWGVRFVYLIVASVLFGALYFFHHLFAFRHAKRNVLLYRLLSYSLVAEAALGFIVLFFSAYVSMTTPPFMVEGSTFLHESIQGDIVTTLSISPYEYSMLSVAFADENGLILGVEKSTVIAQNHTLGIGPNMLSTHKRDEGTYVFNKRNLTPHGEWELEVIGTPKDSYDIHARFLLQTPDDFEARSINDFVRTFDSFTKISILVGTFLLFCSLLFVAIVLFQTKAHKNDIHCTFFALPPHFFYLGTGAGVLLALAVYFSLSTAVVWNQFKYECLRDGNTWMQALPARNFEATAPNTLLGCTVHSGHYHFVDVNEYHFWKNEQ